MARGRPPKPTARKILEGDQPCRINRNEPVPPEGGVGPCPANLDDLGRDQWHRMVPILEAMGVLTSADAEALAFFCKNWSIYHRAHQVLDEEGLIVPTQFSVKPHPMLAVALNAEKAMDRIMSRFGMTPADRARLSLKPKDDDDPMARWAKEANANHAPGPPEKGTKTDGKPAKSRRKLHSQPETTGN